MQNEKEQIEEKILELLETHGEMTDPQLRSELTAAGFELKNQFALSRIIRPMVARGVVMNGLGKGGCNIFYAPVKFTVRYENPWAWSMAHLLGCKSEVS